MGEIWGCRKNVRITERIFDNRYITRSLCNLDFCGGNDPCILATGEFRQIDFAGLPTFVAYDSVKWGITNDFAGQSDEAGIEVLRQDCLFTFGLGHHRFRVQIF